MGRVLIIGAGGVGTVVAHKVAQNADVFTDISQQQIGARRGLIVGCIQVVDTRLQTGFHNGKVLIRKSNVDYHFRLKVIE